MFESIFGKSEFAPHGWCLLVAAGITGAPCFFRRGNRRVLLRDPAGSRLFRAGGARIWRLAGFSGCSRLFILACGTTHWFGILTIWYPDYWTEGGIKLVTAALSVATAVAEWVLMPRALAMPTPAQYRAVTSALEHGGGASGNRGAALWKPASSGFSCWSRALPIARSIRSICGVSCWTGTAARSGSTATRPTR